MVGQLSFSPRPALAFSQLVNGTAFAFACWLFSRMLQPGETVGLDGAYPLRVKIGNAQATEVSFKGQRVDLTPLTSRDNVAKLELK